MKRVACLVTVVALVAGCGGTEVVAPAPVESTSKGMITITLRPAAPGAPSLLGSLEEELASAALALPSPTDIRFVVSNASTGFKSIQDISVAGTQVVNIPVPAANGYVLDAISWASCGSLSFGCMSGYHYILKFGEATGINVIANQQTAVEMTLQPPSTAITPPETASEGDPVVIPVSRPSFLKNFWYMQSATSPFTGVTQSGVSTPYSSGSSITINAPTPRDGDGNPVPGTLYFQAQFFLDDRYTAGGSEWAEWVYYYPNPLVGDAAVSCGLTVPTGGIGVTVNY